VCRCPALSSGEHELDCQFGKSNEAMLNAMQSKFHKYDIKFKLAKNNENRKRYKASEAKKAKT